MKYLSLDKITEAREYIKNNVNNPDTFSGLMLLIYCGKKEIENYYLESDMSKFSKLVDAAFYLNEYSEQYPVNTWYSLFSSKWIDIILSQSLSDKKISIIPLFISFFWYEDIAEFKKNITKFKKNIGDKNFNKIFDCPDNYDSIFTESNICTREKILKFYIEQTNSTSEFYTISFNNKFLNKRASDLAGAPFSQTLYTSNKIKRIVLVFAFDFMNDFNIQLKRNEQKNTLHQVGSNKIIYGAPGAGKSTSVSKIVGKNYIRTVFHPETQYSDFIGCLKPHKDSTGSITYSFRKGPFIQILEKALLDTETHYFLVIEELNRANTAAVFGEIFQLLDRDENGKSEYPILIQDEDLYDALKSVEGLKTHPCISNRELMIPNNLSIIATMNSSDQAVFPLDTAFKRRWIFEYLPIDFTECATGGIPIYDTDLSNVEWRTIAQAINTVLVQLKVVEDKLIGPWFIKDSDLTEDRAGQTLIGKICSYLWDDALKYKSHNDEIFKRDIHSYGQLHQMYSNKECIFSEKFIETLKAQKILDEMGKTESL